MIVTDALQSRSYNALRFSTHIYNSEAELDRLTEALEKLTR
jgi:selenocysteine lyase/cysteine desulfurase